MFIVFGCLPGEITANHFVFIIAEAFVLSYCWLLCIRMGDVRDWRSLAFTEGHLQIPRAT